MTAPVRRWPRAVQSACFSQDGRSVFSASWDKTIRKWRLSIFPAVKRVD